MGRASSASPNTGKKFDDCTISEDYINIINLLGDIEHLHSKLRTLLDLAFPSAASSRQQWITYSKAYDDCFRANSEALRLQQLVDPSCAMNFHVADDLQTLADHLLVDI